MKITKKLIYFFDKLEDKIRARLSKFPIIYGFIGGVGVVLFWRGVWYLADVAFLVVARWHSVDARDGQVIINGWLLADGLISFLIGSILLLLTGLFVINFLGSGIIISGIKREEKVMEKAEKEFKSETDAISGTRAELKTIERQLSEIENSQKQKNND